MQMHSRLAYVYWFSSGKVSCAWSHLRGLNLAERYPPERRARPGLLRARARDDDAAVVRPRAALRAALSGDPARPPRRVGAGPEPELHRGRAVRRLEVRRSRRRMPGGQPPAAVDGRPVGGQHRQLEPRPVPLPEGRAGRRRRGRDRVLPGRDGHRRRDLGGGGTLGLDPRERRSSRPGADPHRAVPRQRGRQHHGRAAPGGGAQRAAPRRPRRRGRPARTGSDRHPDGGAPPGVRRPGRLVEGHGHPADGRGRLGLRPRRAPARAAPRGEAGAPGPVLGLDLPQQRAARPA